MTLLVLALAYIVGVWIGSMLMQAGLVGLRSSWLAVDGAVGVAVS